MKTRVLLFSTAAILVIAGACWIFYGPETSPGFIPAPAGQAWSGIELPAPSYSPVEKLRAKTVAGKDKFIVETREREVREPLKTLQKLFLEPGSKEAIEQYRSIISTDFLASPFTPARKVPLFESRLTRVMEESGFPPPSITGPAFPGGLLASIAPLEKLTGAELKVIGISEGEELSEIEVLFSTSGTSTEGVHHQWSGEALLGWKVLERKFSFFQLRKRRQVILSARPFQDITARALGANESYGRILLPSIDHFRSRLDAAVGIGVYGHNGLAVGDADGDGLEDLYVLTAAGLPNLLYRCEQDGTFSDASREAGVDLLDGTSQALFLDLDNDSDQDLFLVTEQRLVVLLNDGSGRFLHLENAIPEKITGSATPLSAAAADYDLDGLVDIHICSYVFWRGGSNSAGTRLPIPYHEAHNGAANLLLKNLGGGRFSNATEASGLNRDNQRFSFAAAWGDYDDDGYPDLYTANDFGSNNLWRNKGDGTFEEATIAAGVEDVGAGMSVSWEDYDNDGDLDLYVGNMFSAAGRRVTAGNDYKADDQRLQAIYRRHARGNSLFSNAGDGSFEDVSISSGAWFGRWAWGCDFLDFNLDGNEDLYVQNGFLTNNSEHDL